MAMPDPQPALPPREPRPFVIHFLVDSAVCFLAILILGLIWGIGWVVLLVVSLVVGARRRRSPGAPKNASSRRAPRHPTATPAA